MKFSDRRHMLGYNTKYPSISMYTLYMYVLCIAVLYKTDIYVYRLDSKTLGRSYIFALVNTFDSFMAGLGRNRVGRAFCSAQKAHKPVQTGSAKQAIGFRNLLS